VDWEAVISNALDLQPNSTSKIEPGPDKVAKLTEEPAMVANKKKLLRDRLRASKNNPASEIAIQDWYFSKDQLTDQSSSGIMQEEISTSSSNFQAEDSVIYDLNVEPDIDEISTVQLSKDEWVKEEETISHSADLKINKPGDTQPIAINNKENLSETIASSLKALFGGNRNYAADKIKAAIYKTENSKEIIPLLEDAVISHPEFIELLTLLAEAYQQSGNKEKALETYIKIQNSIQI
jgi:tetratricopeptide (TPR) repeat protein